ncbi:hypothetical protein R1sor_014507 [Riccia sorocarpa]|uniref:tRNA-dihydrouridine(16/17) synthase [NAD(P)(+)] n=1 Tax=Riccia sorocarpa TaxID=122646 RepID=A0ABD3H9U7_9MARC
MAFVRLRSRQRTVSRFLCCSGRVSASLSNELVQKLFVEKLFMGSRKFTGESGLAVRIGQNGAAAEGAVPMAVEREDRDLAGFVNEEAPVNLHVRVNAAVDPPAELAEMVIGDERLDESAPTTPDCAEERIDLSGLHGRNFDLKFSGVNGSASKRMRLDSPIYSQIDDLKEKHIAAAWEHWRRLGAPRLHVAPMVDQSELPFRMMCRKYGATAAYTPMLHSRLFVQDHKYRKEFSTCPEDRPLFVQFCANNPDTLLEAGRLVEGVCDYVDLNLGCPQRIAKRGNYGAFLMDNLPLVEALVKKLSSNLKTPVSCKIRLFPDIKDTLAYARMLEEAGCSLLAVHGRTRDQKNGKLIRADWEAIREVREVLRIPVLANGNIRWLEDVQMCIAATGVEGVLSAESILENPAMFGGYRPLAEVVSSGTDASSDGDESFGSSAEHSSGEILAGFQKTVDERVLCLEYLDLCEKYPVPMRMVRGHVHKILGNYWFRHHPAFREELNKQFKLTVEWLKDLVQRMMALPPPQAGKPIIPGEDTKAVINGIMNAEHGPEPSHVRTTDAQRSVLNGVC